MQIQREAEGKSAPVLSFLRVCSVSTTVPSASTASMPSTEPCSDPYLSNLKPPAHQSQALRHPADRMPPMQFSTSC